MLTFVACLPARPLTLADMCRGKRCFYDMQCKPKTEDLVYPNCTNAFPLTNPWPKGQCCFYNTQYQSQCVDKRVAPCSNLPKCAVPGCQLCIATNSSMCERCSAGYVLNVDTRRCECAPGYYGTTACDKRCDAGTVSYGGKLPITQCITCPAGRVANRDQSECVGMYLLLFTHHSGVVTVAQHCCRRLAGFI